MRAASYALLVTSFLLVQAQVPLYEYVELERSLSVPENINHERSLVIVHVPDKIDDYTKVGAWEKLSFEAHKGFITMGIDPILYINHYDLVASDKSKEIYAELFKKRDVKNLIFLTRSTGMIELTIAPFDQTKNFIANNSKAFYVSDSEMYTLMLKTGREIRRADHEIYNFLIPEKPSFLTGLSIVEKTQLKNYPGILRRSTLAVERFAPILIPKNVSPDINAKIEVYNLEIEKRNKELEDLIKQYPYDYVLIDPMSDEDLLRNKHQFVLRSISGQAQTIRQMLDYKVIPNETDFVSVIPVLPDQTRAKPIPKSALVYKFYIKQNISKNVHVGEWDADTLWQDALRNMIGNLILEHESDR